MIYMAREASALVCVYFLYLCLNLYIFRQPQQSIGKLHHWDQQLKKWQFINDY